MSTVAEKQMQKWEQFAPNSVLVRDAKMIKPQHCAYALLVGLISFYVMGLVLTCPLLNNVPPGNARLLLLGVGTSGVVVSMIISLFVTHYIQKRAKEAIEKDTSDELLNRVLGNSVVEMNERLPAVGIRGVERLVKSALSVDARMGQLTAAISKFEAPTAPVGRPKESFQIIVGAAAVEDAILSQSMKPEAHSQDVGTGEDPTVEESEVDEKLENLERGIAQCAESLRLVEARINRLGREADNVARGAVPAMPQRPSQKSIERAARKAPPETGGVR